ncbi:MAG: histidine kinase [Solirubrobacteraceae bacterium]
MEPAVGARVLPGPQLPGIEPWLIGVLSAAAVAVTATVTAAGARVTTGASLGGADLEAIARSVIVGIPLLVAFYACQRSAHARFGRLLLIVSGLYVVATLSTSSSPLLYSVGRIGGWLAEAGLAYTLLTFPSGRLRTRFDRRLVASFVGLVTILYLPTVLLVTGFPSPWEWSTCVRACPDNAFMILSRQPGVIDTVVAPGREALTALLFLIVAAVLVRRIRVANPLLRRTLTPVLAVAIVRMTVFAAALAARRIDPDSTFTQAGVWMLAFAVPAISVAFLVGLLRWHLFISAGIRSVNSRLRQMPGPGPVQRLLRDAFDDPELQISSWSGSRHGWITASGDALSAPSADPDRWFTEAHDGSGPTVGILHDVALRDDAAFVEAAVAACTIAFASDRVAARTERMVRELRASRGRIMAAADTERRRIERDLHDGAQQRLVGLCIHLELAAERAEPESPLEAAELRGLAVEVEQALDEIRALTHGIYPAMLLEGGLAEAVRSAALRSPVPASVQVHGLGKYPQEIAAAVYFCCVEALQNVAKHAPEAHAVRIVLRESDSVLVFSVSDDGVGLGADGARVGAGLINMRDRMATVGGQLSVRSRPGHGTRVRGRVPLSTVDRTPAVHTVVVAPRTAPGSRRRSVEPT